MIVGTGLDLVSIKRIKQAYTRRPAFSDRILTPGERKVFTGLKEDRQAEFLAGRFAAKEAYAKAKGCGIGRELSFQDIQILPDEKGKPHLQNLAGHNADIQCHVSISHTEDTAAAQVIIEQI